MQIRKLKKVKVLDENTYSCEVEIFYEQENVWVKTTYIARKGDNSPVNLLILDRISTGKYKQ